MPKTRFKNLAAKLVEHGISYNDLAKKLNVSYKTITNKMNGQNYWRHDEMNVIKEDIFENKYPLDYLFQMCKE